MTPYNQITHKSHQTEMYYVNNCQKSSSDKRFVFDVFLRDKSLNNVHTFQAMSYDDYKAWFAIMDGKELTPVLSNYSVKSDPVYTLDKNGLNFIKRCIQLLEDDKLNEEGVYRKNGVSHKINQFIERNFHNISSSLVQSESNNDPTSHQSTASLMVTVLKNTIPHSTSSSTLSLSNQNTENVSSDTSSNNMTKNHSSSNLLTNNNSFVSEISEDTCTITSALKHYLIRLKEPLMTFSYNQQFLNACSKTQFVIHRFDKGLIDIFYLGIDNFTERVVMIHKLLFSLPTLNFEAIKMLMKHLYVVSTHSQQNKMTTSNLSTCLGPTVFRTEQECVSNLYNIKFYSEIIELLIIHHDKMFEPSLDENFLKNLSPLKSPPTMMSSTNLNSNNSVSPLLNNQLPPSVSILNLITSPVITQKLKL